MNTTLNYIIVSLALLGAGCGQNKKPVQKKAQPTSENATGKAPTYACISAQECPQVRLALSGLKGLGGPAETLMLWDVGGIAPDDKSGRVIMASVETKLPGMEIVSKSTDPRVSINWKPATPSEGSLQFRLRDVTRCQKLSGGTINCADMSTVATSYEQILTEPYQVVPKNQVFDARNSEFFRQFHCDALSSGAAGAVIAGAKVGVDVLGSVASDGRNPVSTTTTANGIATVVDYLVNGDEEPTAYDCLRQSQAAKSSAPD